MSITFFTMQNNTTQQFNYPLTIVLTLALVACIIILIKSIINHKQVPSIISCFILGLWFLAGILLCCSKDREFISNWINSAVAIGTIGAVITSLYLYKKSAKDNYNNLAKSQRAYILIENIIISTPIPDSYLFDLIFKNTGLTIATNIKVKISAEFYKIPLQESFEFIDENNAINDISNFNCGAGLTFKAPIEKSFIDFHKHSRVNKQLLIYGWLEYNDVYTSDRHRTEFCHFISATNVEKKNTIKFSQRIYHKFNNIDEHCLHEIKTF